MRLTDYSLENGCFEFDPETGTYSHIKLPVPRKSLAGYCGMAQLLRSPGEGKVLVALYLRSGDAWFSIGAEKWRLFDESVFVKHTDTTFRCELSVHQGGQCVRKLRYRRRDWFALILDPTYDYMDFDLAHLALSFVPLEGYPLQKQREDFIRIWSAGFTPAKAATAKIHLTRDSVGWDSRQRYQVMINGIEHGQIKSGGVFECQIPHGKVRLQLRVYWQEASNTLEFDADEYSITHLRCGSNLRGWKIFRMHKVTNDWIWLRFAGPRIVDVT